MLFLNLAVGEGSSPPCNLSRRDRVLVRMLRALILQFPLDILVGMGSCFPGIHTRARRGMRFWGRAASN